jgi:hypothetical protein
MNMVTVARINRNKSVSLRVRRYFKMNPDEVLWYGLRTRGLWQADLVLCLLRLGCKQSRDHIAELIGHPITVCPAQKRSIPILMKEKKSRVTYVIKNNPRYPNTGAYERFQIFRAGRTVEECFSRGITPRDYRQAVRHGWIQVKEPENYAQLF